MSDLRGEVETFKTETNTSLADLSKSVDDRFDSLGKKLDDQFTNLSGEVQTQIESIDTKLETHKQEADNTYLAKADAISDDQLNELK
jgi:hypothetical protein